MRNWRLFTLMVLTITTGAFLVGCSADHNDKHKVADEKAASVTTSAPKRGIEVGNFAPEFQLVQMDGSRISLGDLRGQPAVLDFWASWCVPCRYEVPHVNKLADTYVSRGVRVFGINVLESQERTESGIKDFGIRYAVARDVDGNTVRAYKVEGIPTVIFLDSKGNVRYAGNGLPADYSKRLDTLLAERQ